MNLTFLVIFSISVILLIYLIETTPVKNHKTLKGFQVHPKEVGQNLSSLGEIAILKILVLVSKTEKKSKNSRSCLVVWDWKKLISISSRYLRLKEIILGLVSKHEIRWQKFSFSSQCARLNMRNSHSRLENWKIILADLWRWELYKRN